MSLPSTPQKIRVMIVDDHDLTRYSLKLLLSCQPNMELVGLASNGAEAIELIHHYDCDVVVLDLQMPVMDGLTAAAHIHQIAPKTKILAYSSVEDPQIEVMVQTAPVHGFCAKEVNASHLVKIIETLGQQNNSLEEPEFLSMRESLTV